MSQATHAAHAPANAHDDEELAHFLSPWPLVVALAMALMAIGVVVHPIMAFVGIVAVFGGLAGWVYEDMHHYDHPPHPELFHHGKAPNPFWGVILFLGTEVMLFGGLFMAYFMGRTTAIADGLAWPQEHVELPILSTGINTLILIASGATMHFAQHNIAHGRRNQFKIGLILTLLLGGTFLALQVREYIHLIGEGLTLSSSFYGSIFYGLTGTHGFHVFGGLVAIFTVFVRGLGGQFGPGRYLAVEGAAFYWHFVDVVWVFLYAVIYLQWL